MQKIILILGILVAGGAWAAGPAATPSGNSPLLASDIFAMRSADDAQISPDGRYVAYVRTQADIMTDRNRQSIWLVDLNNGTERKITGDDEDGLQPRWPADSRRLAYESKTQGKLSLAVWGFSAAPITNLAPLTQVPPSIAWSPDGKQIAYAAFVPRPRTRIGEPLAAPPGAQWAKPLQVIDYAYYHFDESGEVEPGYVCFFVVSSAGGAARQISNADFDVRGPKRPGAQLAWSKDGTSIFVSGRQGPRWEFDPIQTDIFAISIADGSIQRLTSRDGPDWEPKTSPDGRHIAYLGWDMQHVAFQNAKLYIMDPDGRNSRQITTPPDLSLSDISWSGDGKSIYAQTSDHAIAEVLKIDMGGKSSVAARGVGGGLPTVPYTAITRAYSVSNSGKIAYIDAVADRPGDVFVSMGGKPRRLTDINREFLQSKEPGKIIKLPVTSAVDGKALDAWIVTPPHYSPSLRYPAILEIHGGPYGSYGPFFSLDHQLYAAAGYVVIYTNFRGSTSYGEAFAQLNQGKFPGDDFIDDMSAVDAAISAGYADADRLYITGGSNGGLLTSWAVGTTDRFKAAVAQKPVIDWFSLCLLTDRYTDMPRDWFGPMPWEDPMAYINRSPISRVGHVKTPTMLMVGTDDKRTPPSQSEEFYNALLLRNIPTALIRIPGGSHGGMSPSLSMARVNAILAWFARFPGDTPSTN